MTAVTRKQILLVVLRAVLLTVVTAVLQYAMKSLDEREGMSGSKNKYKKIAQTCITRIVPTQHPPPTLKAIGGMCDNKQFVQETIIASLRLPRIFFNKKAPMLCTSQRILMCGPPGTGKTMLARAIAYESRATFMTVTLSTIEDKYFGETPKILRAIFDLAVEKAPTVLFFDEIDGIMRRRRDDDQGCVYGMKTEFLQLMDNLQPDTPVVIVGCTNVESSLDAALLRRFSVTLHMDLPSLTDRIRIVSSILEQSHDRMSDQDVRTIAARTDGYSGSRLHTLYRQACSTRVRRLVRDTRIDASSSIDDVLRTLPKLTIDDWSLPCDEDASDEEALPASLEEPSK